MKGGRAETLPSDDDVFAYYPDVHLDRDNIDHYRALMAGRLMINRCAGCGWWIYPHRPICPHCLSWDVHPAEVSGRGRLYMYTALHQSRDPDRPIEQPIVFAAVELVEQEGLRYLSRIVDCPPEAFHHDMPLRLVWTEREGRRWPAFEPALG